MDKRIWIVWLSLCLLLSFAAPACAVEEEAAESVSLRISTEEQLLAFAEECRLDSYSWNLEVSLEADLDLTGMAFEGIPVFSGTFEGNGHTVCGVEITADGSVLGFFRYLTATAVIRNLNIRGSVCPGGSRGQVGGIAGSNSGTIENCSFDGMVSGGDYVGGLAGINTVSGVLESGHVQGEICGNHFVGGMAGKNNGVIRSCMNSAAVNNTAQENSVKLSDITIDSLVSSESSGTATDIGGIAGNSSGVIRDCENQGSVGYLLMGYNVGGIAGTQSGYIVNCVNRGKVLGRKETGGIVGQMEPAALVEYDEDALQILKGQLETMGSLTNKTASNVQSTAQALYSQVNDLQDQVEDAKDAVGMLLPDLDDPQLPDLDSIQAARNNLSSSLSGMGQTLQGMQSTTQSAIGTLSNNLYALQNQISAMSATLGNVSETLGGSIDDVSDADTPDDLTGKVANCVNYGEVLADLNAGGIAGAMALENDLDIEEDLTSIGETSLNFESELRAVILDCENHGAVTAEKQQAGGIVGWQSMGLVRDCRNTGDVGAEDADYIGGISGKSGGYIRTCSARCALSGDAYVGGIAGAAAIVTDCRSMVTVSGSERLGAVLGLREEDSGEEETPLSGNYYLSVAEDMGAIDGISYDGLAQPLPEKAFFALEDLPDLFQNVTVTFCYEDGTERQISLTSGSRLAQSQIPAVPEKAGFTGEWEGLAQADLSHILFDLTFEAKYTAHSVTLQSDALGENGLPILLVQGDFAPDAQVCLTNLAETPELEEGETLLAAWRVSLSGSEAVTAARLQIPDGCDADSASVLVRGSGGSWKTADLTADGSYLVFPLEDGDDAVALIQVSTSDWLLAAAVAAAAAGIALTGLLIWRKKRRSKK